ncbi:MAG: alpha/beta hydrolase [Gemmatimonadota bacterium]|nr:alpha/beta hydrolase [Gemmatimonadota bacterium]
MNRGVGEGGAHGTGHRLTIEGEGHPPVSGVMVEAPAPAGLLVLGHGAGAPMTHPFMEALALALSAAGISTLRYNFAYAEAGRRRPDPLRRLLAVVASALVAGRERAGGLPLFAGGKSMGGRMTSMFVAGWPARGPTPDVPAAAGVSATAGDSGDATAPVAGLVFFGFPLHAPGRRGTERGEHLAHVPCPMLFHQGTRDRLADLDLLRPLLKQVGPRATLHVVDGGDHSLRMLKRSGRTLDDVLAEVAAVTAHWAGRAAAAGTATR